MYGAWLIVTLKLWWHCLHSKISVINAWFFRALDGLVTSFAQLGQCVIVNQISFEIWIFNICVLWIHKKTRYTPNLQIIQISFLTHSSISKVKIIRNARFNAYFFCAFFSETKRRGSYLSLNNFKIFLSTFFISCLTICSLSFRESIVFSLSEVIVTTFSTIDNSYNLRISFSISNFSTLNVLYCLSNLLKSSCENFFILHHTSK